MFIEASYLAGFFMIGVGLLSGIRNFYHERDVKRVLQSISSGSVATGLMVIAAVWIGDPVFTRDDLYLFSSIYMTIGLIMAVISAASRARVGVIAGITLVVLGLYALTLVIATT